MYNLKLLININYYYYYTYVSDPWVALYTRVHYCNFVPARLKQCIAMKDRRAPNIIDSVIMVTIRKSTMSINIDWLVG